MTGFNKIAVFMFLFSLLMLGGCDTADDNNPSPVPDARDKFVGNWNVTEICSKSNYVVTIDKDPSNSAQVLINNFADAKAEHPDTAIIAGSSIVLYAQVNSENWLLEGSGHYNSDETIDWAYALTIGGTQDNCTATYVKN